jgi:hypothetical protein
MWSLKIAAGANPAGERLAAEIAAIGKSAQVVAADTAIIPSIHAHVFRWFILWFPSGTKAS